MSKRPFVEISTKVYDQKLAKKKPNPVPVSISFLREGQTVRIFVKYQAQFEYKYFSFFRGNRRGIVTFYGDWNQPFNNLPQNWRNQLANRIKTSLMPVVEKEIARREKFYGEFKDWEVKLEYSLKLSDIQIREIDEVNVRPDDGFNNY